MENIDVQPIERITIKVIKKVTVRVVELKLFTSATISVYMYGDNREFVERHSLIMDGDDYKNWNNDDEYLVNYVFTKLGLQKLPKENIITEENTTTTEENTTTTEENTTTTEENTTTTEENTV